MDSIELGCKVRDVVTGFQGVVTGQCTYLNGCTQYMVKPPIDEKGAMREGEWIDSQQLQVVDNGILAASASPSDAGGPMPDAPPKQYMG